MNAALRLLSIRARSRHELEVALRRREVPADIAGEVLRRLAELGYLDDGRFAVDRAMALLRRGRLGARAVLQRLRAHGLSETEARRALSAAEAELGGDPLATARAVLERRGLAGRPLTLKEKGKAARLLQSRGFPASVVAALVGDAPFAPEDD
ncbi:MAG: regulatory protein RecX [Myxococcaceae bacterium]|nr:regulatory protein RecX [Myxococcaceae bacterium]